MTLHKIDAFQEGDLMVQQSRKKQKQPDHTLRVYDNIIELIASPQNPTPMVKLNENFNPNNKFPISLKLEWFNPFGSIKDRAALQMLKDVEFKEGKTLIEATSGNTGIALTGIARSLGFDRIEIAMSNRVPEEKRAILQKLLKVNVWSADDSICPAFPNEGARGIVNGLVTGAGGENYIYPNQYENEKNVEAHYKNTGPEIWKQTAKKITHFFAGIGTGGTIMGIGKFLKEQNPLIEIIGVEPDRTDHDIPGLKNISSLDEDLIPGILDEKKRKKMGMVIEQVSDEEAYQTTIDLIRQGFFVGPSTGAIANVALKYAKKDLKGLAVVISPDNTFKYINIIEKYVKDAGELIES